MSVEKPREFVTIGDEFNGEVMLHLDDRFIQVVGDRPRLSPMYAVVRQADINLAIERRLEKMGIGQDILSHPFQCIMCHRDTTGIAYYRAMNGPLCKEGYEKGHVGHPATPAPAKPQEASLTWPELQAALAKGRTHIASKCPPSYQLRDCLVAIGIIEDILVVLFQGKVTP